MSSKMCGRTLKMSLNWQETVMIYTVPQRIWLWRHIASKTGRIMISLVRSYSRHCKMSLETCLHFDAIWNYQIPTACPATLFVPYCTASHRNNITLFSIFEEYRMTRAQVPSNQHQWHSNRRKSNSTTASNKRFKSRRVQDNYYLTRYLLKV